MKRLLAKARESTRNFALSIGHWWKVFPPVVSMILSVIILFGFSGIAERQHQSDIEKCDRDNISRVSSVEDKRSDARVMRSQLNLWEAALGAAPPSEKAKTPKSVSDALDDNMTKLRQGIAHKKQAVREAIAAQASVATAPGSPIVDCDLAFP